MANKINLSNARNLVGTALCLTMLLTSSSLIAQVTSPGSAAPGVDNKAAQSGTAIGCLGGCAAVWFSTPQRNIWKQLTDEPLYRCEPNWLGYYYDEIDKHPGWTCRREDNRLIFVYAGNETNLRPFKVDEDYIVWSSDQEGEGYSFTWESLTPPQSGSSTSEDEGVYFTFEGGIPDDGFTFMLSQQTTSPILLDSGLNHRFWDTPNILLHSLNTASKIADYHSTERMLRRGGHELNPLLRNRPARIGIILGFGTGGHVLIAWLFHRTGHHKLERWFMVPSIGVSAGAAGWNYRRF